MKLRHALLAVVLALAACAQLNVPAADTFNKKIVAAAAGIEGAAKLATSLKIAGKLSDADRNNVVTSLQVAQDGVSIAAGLGPAAGQDKLAASIAVLTAMQTYLATKGN